jgi:hypothetical protein
MKGHRICHINVCIHALRVHAIDWHVREPKASSSKSSIFEADGRGVELVHGCYLVQNFFAARVC